MGRIHFRVDAPSFIRTHVQPSALPGYTGDLNPFQPLFRNPHIATIAGNFWRRNLDESVYPAEIEYFQTEPRVTVMAMKQVPAREPIGELILLHGLEGSSQAGYVRSMAQAALQAGFITHRLNMRSCGGTESMSETMYHAGLTSDLRWIVEHLRAEGRGPIVLAGYSLGGNVVLKLAGELADRSPDLLAGVVAVSTPIDLMACTQRLMQPQNRVYEWRFVSRLKDRIRAKHATDPERFPIAGLEKVRTVLAFDDLITAPWFGFGNARNYYKTQSSNQFLPAIRVPTLLVQAKDDPLIPYEVYDLPVFRDNPHLRLHAVDHGGHLGFLSRSGYRFWLDELVTSWIAERAICNLPLRSGRL